MPKVTGRKTLEVGSLRLAINLFDLQRLDPEMRGSLFAGRLDTTGAVSVGENDDTAERAVRFTCRPVVAGALCDMVRRHDRDAGDRPTRVYFDLGNGWERVRPSAVLTRVEDGVPVLNVGAFAKDTGVVVVPMPGAYKPEFGG